MVTRLFILLLLALAIVSVSTPAQASTLSVVVYCANNGYSTIHCAGYATGGTGTYAFSPWTISRPGYSYTVSTFGDDVIFDCVVGTLYTVSLTATDSGGASASQTTTTRCQPPAD